MSQKQEQGPKSLNGAVTDMLLGSESQEFVREARSAVTLERAVTKMNTRGLLGAKNVLFVLWGFVTQGAFTLRKLIEVPLYDSCAFLYVCRISIEMFT